MGECLSMKSYRKELHLHTKTRRAYVNITPQVEAALTESGVDSHFKPENLLRLANLRMKKSQIEYDLFHGPLYSEPL